MKFYAYAWEQSSLNINSALSAPTQALTIQMLQAAETKKKNMYYCFLKTPINRREIFVNRSNKKLASMSA